jgi:hypothetical protein
MEWGYSFEIRAAAPKGEILYPIEIVAAGPINII